VNKRVNKRERERVATALNAAVLRVRAPATRNYIGGRQREKMREMR